MWHLATSGSMEEIAEYIQSFGPMAMVVSMVLDIFRQCCRFFTIHFYFYCKWSSIWHVARDYHFLAS